MSSLPDSPSSTTPNAQPGNVNRPGGIRNLGDIPRGRTVCIYARESSRTNKAKLAQQVRCVKEAIKANGNPVGPIFTDALSGKNFDRPGWKAAKAWVRQDKRNRALVACSIPRLFRAAGYTGRSGTDKKTPEDWKKWRAENKGMMVGSICLVDASDSEVRSFDTLLPQKLGIKKVGRPPRRKYKSYAGRRFGIAVWTVRARRRGLSWRAAEEKSGIEQRTLRHIFERCSAQAIALLDNPPCEYPSQEYR